MSEKKVYIVLASDLPSQSALNTVALIAGGLAKIDPDLIGEPVTDIEGNIHQGISQLPIIIMNAKSSSKLKYTYDQLRKRGFPTVPFFEHSRKLKTYQKYQTSMQEIAYQDLTLSGFGVSGAIWELRSYLKRFRLWK